MTGPYPNILQTECQPVHLKTWAHESSAITWSRWIHFHSTEMPPQHFHQHITLETEHDQKMKCTSATALAPLYEYWHILTRISITRLSTNGVLNLSINSLSIGKAVMIFAKNAPSNLFVDLVVDAAVFSDWKSFSTTCTQDTVQLENITCCSHLFQKK